MSAGCAVLDTPADWTKRDKTLEVAFQAINALDAIQTAHIRHHPHLVESHPIPRSLLGENPNPGETAVYFTTLGLSHFLIARSLPPKWRAWYQGGSILFHGTSVISNCQRELCPR